MEEIIGFVLTVIGISVSGVMSPGPLFTANIIYGVKEGAKSGLKVSYGHTVVEFPLIILLGFGIFSLDIFSNFREVISIVGAIGLFSFAGLQMRSAYFHKDDSKNITKYGPFKSGILLSALNPFFIIWWLTIGLKLISDSILFWSFCGIAILFVAHIWMDYSWLTGTAYLSKKSLKFLSAKNYRYLIIGLSILLIYFGITFLLDLG